MLLLAVASYALLLRAYWTRGNSSSLGLAPVSTPSFDVCTIADGAVAAVTGFVFVSVLGV